MKTTVNKCLLVLLFFLVLLGAGCKNDRVHSMVPGHSLPARDSCRFEPDHHYFVTLPDHTGPDKKFPLVIAIDPHGDGLLAVQKFRDALKDLPVVVAGSGKVRNNYPGYELSLNNLYNDLLEKYPVDPDRVLMAGFSGGARMALDYGLRNPVRGIVMFGAGPVQVRGGFQEKQVYAVSGTRDFNFSEQYRPLFSDLEGSSGYVNDYFRGIHEWPPEQYIREAVIYCFRDVTGPFRSLSGSLTSDFMEEADSLQAAGDILFAGKALEKAYYFTDGKKLRNQLLQRISEFRKNPDWIAGQHEIENFLRLEAQKKRVYAEKLQDPDMAWWSGELDTLFFQIDNAEDLLERDHYARLKGFLGIYLYSRINTLLRNGNTSDLTDRMLEIYERVEPASDDLENFKFLLSILKARNPSPSG